MKLHGIFNSEGMTFALRLLLFVCLAQLIFIGSGFYFSHYYLLLASEMKTITDISFVTAASMLILSRLGSEIHSKNERLIRTSFALASMTEFAMLLSFLS